LKSYFRAKLELNSDKIMKYFALLFFTVLIISCGDRESRDSEDSNRDDDYEYEESSECGYEDGTYSASVDYYNPETGYSQTYTLDVDVRDCQVVQINFPSGGWLDEDHITPADIDEYGNATVEGEDGKTYEVNL